MIVVGQAHEGMDLDGVESLGVAQDTKDDGIELCGGPEEKSPLNRTGRYFKQASFARYIAQISGHLE